MEIRQASFEQPERQPWQGPRFEIDDPAAPPRRSGLRRVLSTLTLVTLFVVGGVGFLHNVLPQMIEKEVAKQANGKKKAPPADAVEAPNADQAARGERQHADEEVASDADHAEFDGHSGEIGRGQAERLRWHLEYDELHRRRRDDEVDGRIGVFNDFDARWTRPADKSPPNFQVKPLSD